MSCRNCCFTGRSWYLFWPHLTRSRGCRRILLTWDGIEGSAVIVICQERHRLCLWSLGLRKREIYVFLCALLQDSSQAYSSSLVWFIKHVMFISFNQFTSELLSIEFLWANFPLKQVRSIFNAAAPIPNDLCASVGTAPGRGKGAGKGKHDPENRPMTFQMILLRENMPWRTNLSKKS